MAANLALPRAQRVVKFTTAFMGNGWRVFELTGDDGDFFDLIFPPNMTVLDSPTMSLFVSGGTETLGEDGVWFTQDPDHPLGVILNPDGSTGKDRIARGAGRSRYFLKNDTHRLCILATNVFGQRSYEAISFEYPKGPRKIILAQGQIFILTKGTAKFNGQLMTAPHVVVADTDLVTIEMNAGSYGGWAWRIS